MDINTKIVLASASPSRRMLFENLGVAFEVHVSGADETVPPELTPSEKVEIISTRKLEAVRAGFYDAVVIAADSLVALNGQTLGKPETEDKAAEMLRMLSGNTHHVVTGVSIAYKDRQTVFSQATAVEFYQLTDKEIREYIEAGESMGRAGSYGIEGQGALLVKAIQGDYSNVVGIPLAETFRRVKKIIAPENI